MASGRSWWAGSWSVEVVAGTAAAFHAREVVGRDVRGLWCFRATSLAVVLGSTEPAAHLDPAVVAALGAQVVRRRSGGSAVLVAPGELVWVDLVIGRHDPLWEADVGRAQWWVGEAWVEALRSLGVAGAEVHRGPMVRTPPADRVCFAGLGPGEVTVEGRKVLGVSQRRTRDATRFQTALLLRWDAATMARLCRLDREGAEALEARAVGLAELLGERGEPSSVPQIEDALITAVSALPASP